MNVLHGRAAVHLASALVPTIVSTTSESVVKIILIFFAVVLFASLPISYSLDAYVLDGTGIAYIDIVGCAFLIVDIEHLGGSRSSLAAAQLGGRVLRVFLFSRHAVLVYVDWAASSSAARRASPKLEVASHLFDMTATRGSLLLAATAAVVSGSSGGRADTIWAMVALSGIVSVSLLVVAWSLDSALVAPVEKLLGLLTLGASGVLESLDKDTGDLKPSRLKRDGTLLESAAAAAASDDEGGGGGKNTTATSVSADEAAQNMADASAALALTSSKQDLSAHAVTQLALAMTRTLASQMEGLALEKSGSGGSGSGGNKAGNALVAGGKGGEGGRLETVPLTPTYDDRVVVETWYPISTQGNPMLDFLASQRHMSDDHIGFTADSMKGSWEFDVLRLKTRSEVLALVFRTFETQGLVDHFGLSPTRVHNFILEVADRYLPNHYHNLWHAADVCFTTWRFLHESECVEWMTPVEVLAALLAAYGHDVGHPGVNNAFLVATSSDLALLHNDHSPLENMHSTLLAAVLRDTAVLEPLTLNEAREARAIMISAILGTDMMHHFSQISDLRIFYEANGCLMPKHGGVHASETMAVEETKRRFIIDMFVHAADVGNPGKEWTAGKSWSYLVMDEFWCQGDRERELYLPVGPMNDRFTANVALTQMNFAEHLVFPLFLVLIELFPSLEPIGRFITKNVGHWSQIRVTELVADVAKQQRLAARKRQESGGGLRNHSSARSQTLSDETWTEEDEAAAGTVGAVGLEQQLESMSEGERMECQELLQRGPQLDLVLTGALSSLIVLKKGE